MTISYCDFCGKKTEVNQIQEWLKSTGVQDVCDRCLDKIEKINREANKHFDAAKNEAIKDWIITNKTKTP